MASAASGPALLVHLTSLSCADPEGVLAAAPPPAEAEAAAKALSRLCEQPATPTASASAERERELAALLEGGGAALRTLCAAIKCATDAIDAIERDTTADTADCGLLRWGHLRVNALQVLLQLASSEARCVALVEQTDGGTAAACVELLASRASRTDREGTRTCANLLRNLAMPARNRPRLGALAGLFPALLKHVPHLDPNTEAVIAAAMRILVEGCPTNAVRAAQACALAREEGGGEGSGEGGGEGGGAEVFRRIVQADVARMHPFCRAELSRFIALCITAVCETAPPEERPPPPVQLELASPAALGFAAFLLASRHAPLHHEFCAALRAARRAHEQAGSAHAWAERVGAIAVPVRGTEKPLREVLAELAAAGTVAAADASLADAPPAPVS